MFLKLLLAFTIVPLVELYILLQLAQATTLLTTLAIVIVTGVIGTYLARWQGTEAWARFREAAGEGRVPSSEIQDGLLIFFAGGLLLTPGLLTDAFGFFLLIPFTRAYVKRYLSHRFKGSFQFHSSFQVSPMQTPQDGNTIEPASSRTINEETI